MRAAMKYDHKKRLLTITVFFAPHRRAHRAVLAQYRKELWQAANAAGIKHTMNHQIGLSALFIDPTGPDLDNLITALFQALDGKTGSGPTILADDRQIVWLEKAGIMFH